MVKKTLEQKIDTLAGVVERGFAASDKKFAALADDIADIREKMATRDDVRTIVREETADIRATIATKDDIRSIHGELTSIRRDLNTLQSKVDNLSGVTKEIDHALARIRRIEKHLGIEADVTA